MGVDICGRDPIVGVIVKSGVWETESGGDLVEIGYFHTVFEFDSGYHFSQVIETA